MAIREEFATTITFSSEVVAKAEQIAETFSQAMDQLEAVCGSGGREMALVKTKMQEAKFWAVKAMATREKDKL